MGLLLKIIKPSQDEVEEVPQVYIDFEEAQPSQAEMGIYTEVQPILDQLEPVLKSVKEYGGAADMIRKAISNPKDSTIQEETWEALTPLLEKLGSYYDFSIELTLKFQLVLKSMCDSHNVIQTLTDRPATVKCMALIIDFAIHYDEIKMANPALQNDLSYYRRALSNTKVSLADSELVIPRDKANKVSLFLAGPTPIMSAIIQSVNKNFTADSNPSMSGVAKCIAIMVRICSSILERPDQVEHFKNTDTKYFILRVMVGLIIILDHVSSSGVFCRGAPIDTKSCIKLIVSDNSFDNRALLNTLKFTSKNFNSDSTIESIKAMLNGPT